jgi:hypothetical protein
LKPGESIDTTVYDAKNADLLDGQDGSYYQPASTALTTTTTFGGDVSGTYNNIVVADDSHNHIISNVDGLQTALDGKLATTGKAADSEKLDGQDGSYYAAASSINGTDNYIPRFNGTSALENSIIYDDGTNIGIGTAIPGYKLEVNGSFAATTKSFIIDHPTKEGKKLRYASLEGPENGVYIRGKSGADIIELPEYWEKLVDSDSVTVTLTSIGKFQPLYVISKNNKEVEIGGVEGEYNYVIYGERIDVEKLIVEVE